MSPDNQLKLEDRRRLNRWEASPLSRLPVRHEAEVPLDSVRLRRQPGLGRADTRLAKRWRAITIWVPLWVTDHVANVGVWIGSTVPNVTSIAQHT
jgi:hypothetical protein